MEKNILSLRERKFAETKIRILNVFIEKLEKKEFTEISVIEICEGAQISYKTFFNYFQKKSDLLSYYLSFRSIDTQYFLTKLKNKSFEEKIYETLDYVCEWYKKNFKITKEITSFIALYRSELKVDKLSLAEYLSYFPKYKWVENIVPKTIEKIFWDALDEAIKNNEIKKDIDKEVFFTMLRSIIFWIFLSVRYDNVDKVKILYKKHAEILINSFKS